MLKNAAVFISIALAGLYALGISSYQGYLDELGIEETQFMLSADRYFFQGFISAMTMGLWGVTYFVFAAAGVVFVAEVGVIGAIWIKENEAFKKLGNELNINDIHNDKGNPFVIFSGKMFSYGVLTLVLYFILLIIILLSDKSGRESAKSFIEKIDTGNVVKKEIILKGKSDPLYGYSVVCNSLQCSYIVDGKSMVLNNRDVASVVSLGRKS